MRLTVSLDGPGTAHRKLADRRCAATRISATTCGNDAFWLSKSSAGSSPTRSFDLDQRGPRGRLRPARQVRLNGVPWAVSRRLGPAGSLDGGAGRHDRRLDCKDAGWSGGMEQLHRFTAPTGGCPRRALASLRHPSGLQPGCPSSRRIACTAWTIEVATVGRRPRAGRSRRWAISPVGELRRSCCGRAARLTPIWSRQGRDLLTRTWVTARNHRRITAPQTRTFNHGAALGVPHRPSRNSPRSRRPDRSRTGPLQS